MKKKVLALILGLVTCGVIIVAQEQSPLPPVPSGPDETDPALPEPTPNEPTETDPALPSDPYPTDPTDPVPGETVPGETVPGETVPGETVPVEPLPGETLPGETLPGETVPVEPLPGETGGEPVEPGVPGAVPAVSTDPLEPAGAEDDAEEAPEGDAEEGAEIVPLIVIDEVPLTDAIRNLARQSSLNFQFDPRITTSTNGMPQPLVSIRFENVTAQEALAAVLDNYDLQLVRDPRSKIARVTIKDPAQPDPLIAKIVQLKYSDPTNLVELVMSTLSPRSQVVAHPRTTQLIVTTTEIEMPGALEMIARLDTAPRQVLIEGHIVETSKSPETIKGIDWSGTLAGQNFAFGNNLGDPFGVPDTNPLLVGANPASKLLADTAGGFNPGTAFLDADGVSAVLSFLNTDAETEVLSTPRAVTLNNQMARLAVTRAFPVFSVTPGSANSPAGAEVTYTNLGTILEVTPRIAADDNISLRVVPEVSNIDSVDTQVLNGFENTANIYAIRRIEANVMIPSGHTLVMGGLVSDSRTKQYVKVPLLGDIPGLGALFRHQTKSQNKANLLIFVTPTIVEDDAFHSTESGAEFLSTEVQLPEDKPWNSFDSAKPHDWTKPVE